MRAYLAHILLIGALTACGSSEGFTEIELSLRALRPAEVELAPGQAAEIEELHLVFTGVLSDYRCPVGVQCTHAGDASLALGLGPSLAAGPLPMHRIVLHSAMEPRSAVELGVRVTLLELTPEPIAGEPIPTGEYRARIRVVGVDFK